MDNMLIISAVGFTLTFGLLFFFAAKYRAAAIPEETDFGGACSIDVAATGARPQVAVKRAVVGSDTQPNTEVAELKEKVKQLHYRIEELKLVQETKSQDAAKTIARLEQRLATFESEYVNKLQPTLAQLIDELENIKPSQE